VIISSSNPRETMNTIFEMGGWEISSQYIDKNQEGIILYAVVSYEPGYQLRNFSRNAEIPELEKSDQNQEEIFNIVDVQPVPQGGMETFYQYVANNLKYPEEARKEGKEGKVFVEFIIRKNGKIDQVKLFCGPGDGCVEPTVKGFVDELIFQITDVDEYVLPLPSLGLMAGEGIGELNLQRVKMRVVLHAFQPFPSRRLVFIIFHDLFEEGLVFFLGQGRPIRGDGVEDDLYTKFRFLRIIV